MLTKALSRYTYSNPTGDDVSTFIRCVAAQTAAPDKPSPLKSIMHPASFKENELQGCALLVSHTRA